MDEEYVRESVEDSDEMDVEEEHRYDEYEGIARRVDDVMRTIDEMNGKIADIFDKLDSIQAGLDAFIDAGAVIREEDTEDSENLADVVKLADAFDAFDDLDFNM